ncbi:MotA/TolQ/ExbB proton channel family protein [Stieleria sp. TO1_6]|uniref:MotA/TolQ/ExbB proton channel family protein n=1 Tax=Stieleria tagensis TaxID=2956795 RepID=UPI00209A8073|nr:MotA/TolQ/ExbB proton channel family protein [Stieleria tagensis]MCO8120308.1 MotA/TolQ/ExbB proton channel family protein [Stieleria tagensis]
MSKLDPQNAGKLDSDTADSFAAGQNSLAGKKTTSASKSRGTGTSPSPLSSSRPTATKSGGGLLVIIGGVALSAGFYGVVFATQWAPLERYFLGHPVAVAATVLFCVALAILTEKFFSVRRQWKLLAATDEDVLAPRAGSDSPSDQFHNQHDAGFVARAWANDLLQLPRGLNRSQMVGRLREVLTRQSGRGTTKHLADDLRELSGRDADVAHGSFTLIRIIVWAIPMLGFLGTVIGITQTLGGLDFSNGNAAVDNLKSGLYVAFDTTALGLVLSIVAIFLQFPVEKSEQDLLAAIDHRASYLTGLYLPGDDAADNQFELLASLCEGVRAAVAESLSNQTVLWRVTIDEAQGYWQQAHNVQAKSIVTAVEETLVPALRDHAGRLESATERNQAQLAGQFNQWQTQLSAWQQTMIEGADAMTKHQETVLDQIDQTVMVGEQAHALLQMQQTLNANLEKLDQANRSIDANIGAAAGNGMADAMIVLARAVDVLTREMVVAKTAATDNQRRAA